MRCARRSLRTPRDATGSVTFTLTQNGALLAFAPAATMRWLEALSPQSASSRRPHRPTTNATRSVPSKPAANPIASPSCGRFECGPTPDRDLDAARRGPELRDLDRRLRRVPLVARRACPSPSGIPCLRGDRRLDRRGIDRRGPAEIGLRVAGAADVPERPRERRPAVD